MKRVLVAGATGDLGRFVVKAFKDRGYWVRALGRSAEKLGSIKEFADELFIGEVVEPDSLAGVCDGIDIVFSSVGTVSVDWRNTSAHAPVSTQAGLRMRRRIRSRDVVAPERVSTRSS